MPSLPQVFQHRLPQRLPPLDSTPPFPELFEDTAVASIGQPSRMPVIQHSASMPSLPVSQSSREQSVVVDNADRPIPRGWHELVDVEKWDDWQLARTNTPVASWTLNWPTALRSPEVQHSSAPDDVLGCIPETRFCSRSKFMPVPEACAICTVDFTPCGALKIVDTCGHAFHPCCIDRWLCISKSCPLCREEVYCLRLVGPCFSCGVH
eukprot:gnl/TRDRNA2_/TRDRNA2_175908_c0_seq1.p1 gnl/TRDRNA2_/TRDRNA2_175908_c0~~gnl/TRDRNA2_/TRDRNA2_175908_c0_seq1.p1  ORF type:complete len:208 (+),score=8.66 gnl/TRDRNA2_/TRDRNA2_175908_c0_seq1:98-721(+)